MIRGPKRHPAPLLRSKTATTRHLPKPLAASVLLASWSLLAHSPRADELVEVAVIPLPDWQPALRLSRQGARPATAADTNAKGNCRCVPQPTKIREPQLVN